MNKYYIVYNPLTYDLMNRIGISDFNPLDLLSYLTNLDSSELNYNNYLEYLDFDKKKERTNIVGELGLENYGSYYIANQISLREPDSKIFLVDGERETLRNIITKEGKKPSGVFITSISSNFPTTVATSIVLNAAGIPVIIGGIHVSSSPEDVNIFIEKYISKPELVTQVIGAGDSGVIKKILSDIPKGTLQKNYSGSTTLENGVWGRDNIVDMPSIEQKFLKKLPVLGPLLMKYTKGNVAAPFLGCPYSCKFCSISSLPEKNRKLIARNPEDFINELKFNQKNGANFKNRFYLWLPDNLLLGGKYLEQILDEIIASDLKINYSAQISIEIADKKDILKKLRLSGASQLLIGLESLDYRNLDYVNKNAAEEIRSSGLSVREYYSGKIKKIQKFGIAVHGAFMFGMPYDYYNSFDDHTGKEVADFCIENKIGLQPTCFSDLPGSINFNESQKNNTYLYGKKGTIDYLLALCITDFFETNRKLGDNLMNSPLVVTYITYDSIRRVASQRNALKLAMFSAKKSWEYYTNNGKESLQERLIDCLASVGFQLGITAYLELFKSVLKSKNGSIGTLERIYNNETKNEVKRMFENFVKQLK